MLPFFSMSAASSLTLTAGGPRAQWDTTLRSQHSQFLFRHERASRTTGKRPQGVRKMRGRKERKREREEGEFRFSSESCRRRCRSRCRRVQRHPKKRPIRLRVHFIERCRHPLCVRSAAPCKTRRSACGPRDKSTGARTHAQTCI